MMAEIKMSRVFDLPIAYGEFTLVAMSKPTYISMDRAVLIAINDYDENQERIKQLEAALIEIRNLPSSREDEGCGIASIALHDNKAEK
jgi:hypothetical protein